MIPHLVNNFNRLTKKIGFSHYYKVIISKVELKFSILNQFNFSENKSKNIENGESCDKLPEMRVKKPGLIPHIIERRIPSFYGSDQRLVGSETLIIDDVRQSAMLDIDGVNHILKNECLIDADSVEDNLNRVESCQKKLNNRTVIVVEDQLISKAKSNEPLKIDVRNQKAASHGHLNNANLSAIANVDKADYSSSEFLTRSERAQFERVDPKSNRNVKLNEYLVSLLGWFRL